MLPRLLLQGCLVWFPSLPCSSALRLTVRSLPRLLGSITLQEQVLRAEVGNVSSPKTVFCVRYAICCPISFQCKRGALQEALQRALKTLGALSPAAAT